MATEGGGKIKEKRSHPSVKPYEKRKSLLGKLTETVKDLLVPSWIGELISKGTPEAEGQDEDLTSGGRLQGQGLHGRRQADGPRPGISGFQPFTSNELPLPVSRLRPVSAREDEQSMSSDTSTRMQPDLTDYQQEVLQFSDAGLEKLQENLDREMNQTSAFLPNTDPGLSPRSMSIPPAQPATPATLGGSAGSRPEIYSTSVRRGKPFTPAHQSRPSFNVSVFCSPAQGDQSLLEDSVFESSFYPGMTTFGGASAHRRRGMGGAAPYQTALPIRRQLKAKPAESALGAVTSSTARRILETLERMSTPLGDARRLPTDSANADSVLAFTPSATRRTPSLFSGLGLRRSTETPVRGPPTKRLQVPGVASIAKNRQTFHLVPPSTTSTPAASSAAPPQPSPAGVMREREEQPDRLARMDTLPSEKVAAPAAGGKMRRERSNHHFKARTDREETVLDEAPLLRTSFTLPVSDVSMPKIDFSKGSQGLKPGSSSSGTKTASPLARPDSSGTGSKVSKEALKPTLNFTFSTPISKSSPTRVDQAETASDTSDFKFRSPLQAQGSRTAADAAPASSLTSASPTAKVDKAGRAPLMGNGGFAFEGSLSTGKPGLSGTSGLSTAPSFSTGTTSFSTGIPSFSTGTTSFSTGTSSFRPTAPAFSANFSKQGTSFASPGAAASGSSQAPAMLFGAAKELKKGSVMDVLGKKSSSPGEEGFGGFKPAPELKTGSVMDVLGKSPNADKDRSFSGGLRPAAELKSGSVMDVLGKSPAVDKDRGFSGDLRPAAELKTGSVMDVLGKTSNPASGPQPSKELKQGSVNDVLGGKKDAKAGEDLFAKFKAASGSWECGDCLVQNKPEASVCVACNAAKPSAKPSAKNALPQPAAATKTDSLFAKFAKPAGSWECKECFVQNKADSAACAACSTPKPGARSAPAATSVPAATDSLLAKFAKPAGTWECQACLVQNKSQEARCLACSTPRPGATPSSSLASTPASTSASSRNGASSSSEGTGANLTALFKRPAGDWDCKVCDVFNKSDSIKCVCCSSPRPGTEPSIGLAKTTSSFTFGSQTKSGEVTLNAGGGFSFNSTSTASSTASSVFFQSGSSDSKEGKSGGTGSTGGFQFGASEQSKTFGLGSATGSEKTVAQSMAVGGFKFGSGQSVTSHLPPSTSGLAFEQPKTSESTFSPVAPSSFGSVGTSSDSKVVQETSPTAPSVLGSAGTMPAASALCSFGAKPPEYSTMASTGASPAQGFVFGQKPQDSQPPSYSTALPVFGAFGSGQKVPDSKSSFSSPSPALAGIVFGQKLTDSQPPSSASPAVPAVSGFSFGQKSTDAPPPPYTASAAFGGYSFGSAGVANKTVSQSVTSPLSSSGSSFALASSAGTVSKSAENAAGEDKPAAFSFATAGSQQPSMAAVTASENKAGFGGFNFGANKTASPGFVFGQTASNSAGPALTNPPAFQPAPTLGSKRSHEDAELNPPQAKKAFGFGNGPTEASGGFGSAPSENKFGFAAAANSAPVNLAPNSATPGTRVPSLGSFGGSFGSPAPTTTAAAISTVFQFSAGAKAGTQAPGFGGSTTPFSGGTGGMGQFLFGGAPGATMPSAGSPAFGGGGSSAFGSSSASGAQQPSTLPTGTPGASGPSLAFGAASSHPPGGFNLSSTPNFNFSGTTNSSSVFEFGKTEANSSGGVGQTLNRPLSFGQAAANANLQGQPALGNASQNSQSSVPNRQFKRAARRLKR